MWAHISTCGEVFGIAVGTKLTHPIRSFSSFSPRRRRPTDTTPHLHAKHPTHKAHSFASHRDHFRAIPARTGYPRKASRRIFHRFRNVSCPEIRPHIWGKLAARLIWYSG